MNGRNGGVGARPLTVGVGAYRSAGRGENDPCGGGLALRASANKQRFKWLHTEIFMDLCVYVG